MAPWVKGLLHKDKDPSLDPSVHIGPRCKGVFLQCKCWGHKDRWIPGTGWQVRLKTEAQGSAEELGWKVIAVDPGH